MTHLRIKMVLLSQLAIACAVDPADQNSSIESIHSTQNDADVMKENQSNDVIPVFLGEYYFSVREKLEPGEESAFELCSSTFKGTLMSDSSFIVDGIMECKDGSESPLSESIPPGSAIRVPDLPGFGFIARAPQKSLDEGLFSPPRPLGLALVQGHNEFKDFVFREKSSFSLVTAEGGQMRDQGEFTIKVEQTHQSYQTQDGHIFDKVLSYSVSTTGFESIPRVQSGIERRRIVTINSRPPAIMKVVIDTKLSDLRDGLVGSLGDKILGPIEVSIELLRVLKLP